MDTITVPPTPDTGWRERLSPGCRCGAPVGAPIVRCPVHDPELPPCELEGLEPPCEVCDGTGEVTDAPGRAGRAILPCINCDAYDVQQELLRDLYTESRED